MSQYGKFGAQIAATIIAAIIAALSDDRIDFVEWLNVGVLGLGAVGVLGAGNLPAGVWAYMKSYVAAASAALVLWQSLASGGMTAGEWMQLAVAALGAVGVYAIPGPKVYDALAVARLGAGRSGPVS